MQHALDDLCSELLEILARHLINLEADEVRMKAIDYTHLFWACGVMRIDPCNGLMLAKLAHGVIAVAHQFSVQVGHVCRHYASCPGALDLTALSGGPMMPMLMPARLATWTRLSTSAKGHQRLPGCLYVMRMPLPW